MTTMLHAAPAMRDLLTQLGNAGIQLAVEEGRLAISAPKGALTPELRDALLAHKPQLLQMLQATAPAEEPLTLLAQPQHRHEPFALTAVQHAYWLGRHGFIELGGISTHVYTELEPTGLDLPRLERALQRTIERHDMLRAVVTADGLQRILPQVPFYPLVVHDLRGLPAAECDAALLRLRRDVSHRLLPLDHWPLFEVQAARLDGERIRLFICFDMLIADAASMVMVSRDWERFYTDAAWSPPPLELSYRDFARHERAQQQHPAWQRDNAYWKRRLNDLPGPPALPLAMAPAALKQPRFHRHEARLEPARWARLKAEARQRGATASVLLMTAFGDVLRAWSGQAEFTLNLTMFTRDAAHPELPQLVGDFTSTNLLAMRTGESFADRLRQVQDQLAQDLEHRQYGGMSVLRDRNRRLGLKPAASMPVVFTSTLALDGQDATAGGIAFGGEVVAGLSETAQVWLDHQMSEREGRLMLYWDAVDELFPPGAVERMLVLYQRWLCRLADDPGCWTGPWPGDLRELAPVALTSSAASPAAAPSTAHGDAGAMAAEPAGLSAAGSALLEPMRALWQDVLAHDHFDERTSFFAAGGDSLAAIRLADQVRRRFRLEHWAQAGVLQQLFDHPGLAAFTSAIAALAETPAAALANALPPSSQGAHLA